MARTLHDLETPALVVDLDRLAHNLDAMAALAAAHGVALRPHAKTHKSLAIARMQLERGAQGLTVALVEEAEVFVRAGVAEDVRVAFPVLGGRKPERLTALGKRARVSVFADSLEGARALGRAAAAARTRIDVLIEVDSGQRRSGLDPLGPLLVELGQAVAEDRGLRLRGVATHAGHVYRARGPAEVEEIGRAEAEAAVAAARRLGAAGIAVEEVSVGSTPTARAAARVAGVTEIRPGTYAFNDATQVALGVVGEESCALAVLATCVSRPAAGRAVLDAGSKALALDRIEGRAGHGIVLRLDRSPLPGASLERLSEEHGVLLLEGGADVALGERLLVVPNHACPVANLFDRMFAARGERVEGSLPVDARGHRELGPE